MPKIVKLNATQLRDIITEAMLSKQKKSLNEADETLNLSEAYAEFINGALIHWFDSEGVDFIASDANEVMLGTIGEEAAVPGRFEDVDSFAEEIANIVLSRGDIKEMITLIARLMLESNVK